MDIQPVAVGGCQSGQRSQAGRAPRPQGTWLSSPPLPSLTHSYICVLGKETFLVNWPAEGDVGKKELLDQLEGFSEYMSTRGRES